MLDRLPDRMSEYMSGTMRDIIVPEYMSDRISVGVGHWKKVAFLSPPRKFGNQNPKKI